MNKSKHADGESCVMCKRPAVHKVGEEIFDDDPTRFRHNFTAYVCCGCFAVVFGTAAEEFCQGAGHRYPFRNYWEEWMEEMAINENNKTTFAEWFHAIETPWDREPVLKEIIRLNFDGQNK